MCLAHHAGDTDLNNLASHTSYYRKPTLPAQTPRIQPFLIHLIGSMGPVFRCAARFSLLHTSGHIKPRQQLHRWPARNRSYRFLTYLTSGRRCGHQHDPIEIGVRDFP